MAQQQQDTGKFRKNTKDQYYTKLAIAERCVQRIREHIVDSDTAYQWVEPSAGNGVFLKGLPSQTDRIGIDVEPKAAGIQTGDFLAWTPTSAKKRIFFGNPPFGRQGSLAKAFIKHAAQHGDVIAFILPRSFVKPSMSRAFPLAFHCIHSEELEKNSFEVNGEVYDVPCIFQVWQKKEEPRTLAAPVKEIGFKYVKHGEAYHIAFKRAGGLAGKCYLPQHGKDYNHQYHYFLQLEEAYRPYADLICRAVNRCTFPTNTVGPRSLSKSEANDVLNVVLEEVLTLAAELQLQPQPSSHSSLPASAAQILALP